MEDKYFDIGEMMIDYSEMTSLDASSTNFIAACSEEYSHKPYTFKYGDYDVVDMLKSMFSKVSLQKS